MKSKEFYKELKLKYYNNCRGFTLIELMISIAIAAIVIIGVVSIYIYILGPQQKTTATADLQQDGQLILNMIAKDIRQNKIDYDDYNCVAGEECVCAPNHYRLTLTDGANQIKYIRCTRGSDPQYCTSGQNCSLRKCKGAACGDGDICNSNFEEITTSDISVTNFQVTICPGCDPFFSNRTCFQNPRVTIVIEIKSYKGKSGESKIQLQQTVSQRYQEKSKY